MRGKVRWRRAARRSGDLERLGRYLLGFKLTGPGKALVAGIVVSASIGLSSLDNPAHQLLFALFFLGSVSFIAGLIARPRVEIQGRFPPKATAGVPVSVDFTLKNRSRFPAWDVGLRCFNLPRFIENRKDETTIPVLESRASLTTSMTLYPLKRGLYSLSDPRAYTCFPFNIWRTGAALPHHRSSSAKAAARRTSLLVLPRFQPATGIDIPVSRRHQPGGIVMSSHVGDSAEYIGNREYYPGDPINRIDFRSWARLAKPVLREYQEEYFCRIALVLDTYVPHGIREKRDGFPLLEAAVSLTATLADVLTRGEYILDVFAAGPELHIFRAGRSTAHFDNVLEILACIDACRTNPFETLSPALTDELHNISTVIGVFLDWDQSRERLARSVIEAGCSLKIFVVHEGETTLPLGEAGDLAEAISLLTPEQIANGGWDVL